MSQDSKKNTIPPTPTPLNPPLASNDLDDLLSLIARLRQDCPWDIKQTNHSLIPHAIEEVYELVQAIQDDDDEELRGELGDVLLQIVLHCQMYAEQGRFDFGDVIETLQAKMIRRHPHVFDKQNLPNAEAVNQRWQEIKAEEQAEKQARGKQVSYLDSVKAGSGLVQANELQQHASKVGFDWQYVQDAIEKLDEEVLELKEILPTHGEQVNNQHRQELEKELGDCIFAMVNVARKLDINAETAVLTCVHKFRSRFAFIEQQLAKDNKTPDTATLEEMDVLWEQAKTVEQ